MMSSGSFSTVDGDPWADNFPASSNGIGQDFHYLGPMFSTSPEQLPAPLPDPDPSFSHIYSTAHRASSSPNSQALFDIHGRPLQTNTSSYYRTRFEPAPTTQSCMTVNADPPLQGYSSSVVNGPFPAHDTLYYSQDYSTGGQSYYNGSQVFVDPRKAYHAVMGIPYQQIPSSPASVVQSPSTVPPYMPLQPMACRSPTQVPPAHQNPQGNHSITSSPYRPARTSSLPVQSTSSQEVVVCTCKWMKDDGAVCGAQITSATVPEHLATHGIKKMGDKFRLRCRWLDCRLRGDRKVMKRESIVRHVREKHLGYKRTL